MVLKYNMASVHLKDPSLPAPPQGKYPAKAHARKVAEWIANQSPSNGTNGSSNGDGHGKASGVIYLEGQKTRMVEVASSPFHSAKIQLMTI